MRGWGAAYGGLLLIVGALYLRERDAHLRLVVQAHKAATAMEYELNELKASSRACSGRADRAEANHAETRQKFARVLEKLRVAERERDECVERGIRLARAARATTPPPTACPTVACFSPPDSASGAKLSNLTFHPAGRFEVLDWESFNQRHIHSPHRTKARINRHGVWKMETDLVINFAKDHVPPGSKFERASTRVHPLEGTQYILDFVASSGGVPIRHRVEVLKPFKPQLQISAQSHDNARANSNAPLYMIMPLAGRLNVLHQFINILSSALTRGKLPSTSVHLVIVLFHESGATASEHKRAVANVTAALKEAHQFAHTLVHAAGNFSRGGGLEHGTKSLPLGAASDDALLLFIDVDMWFDEGFLYRCRTTPVPGKRVFFPTVFSLYKDHVSIARQMQNAGIWREAGFGMACMYRSDFQALGGFDKSIRGWGMEDVDLFDRMVKRYDVVRAVDEGIMHEWHDKICDPSLPGSQLIMCQAVKNQMEGDKAKIGRKLAEARIELQRLQNKVN